MDLNYISKNVIIIGGTNGIGLSISKGFLEEGANVHVISRTKRNKIENELEKSFSSKINFYRADATILKSLNNVLKLILNRSNNKIDVLVANVGNGAGSAKPIPSEDEWNISWNNNFMSALNTVRVFGPELTNSGGSIVFVSSIAGIEYLGAPSSYSTAKSALNSLAKTLSHKLAPSVRVNVVAPGNIFINNGTWDLKLKENPKMIKKMLIEKVPLNRFGLPEEVSNLVLFLSSKKASFITGSCFVIDGGQTINF